jgi:uncharacterized membrane protein
MAANTRPGYIAGIFVAYLVGLAAYPRLPEPFCEHGCTMALARPLIAFALPSAIAVIVFFLSMLWNRDPIRDRDAHTEATYHAVIRTVVLFLLALHVAVLFALTSGLRPDVVRAVAHVIPVMFGLTLIVIGNLLPRFRPNIVIGIRTSRTLTDRAAWAHTNRVAGYATMGTGVMFLFGGLLPSLPVMEFATAAVVIVVATLAWNTWRSRHASNTAV